MTSQAQQPGGTAALDGGFASMMQVGKPSAAPVVSLSISLFNKDTCSCCF